MWSQEYLQRARECDAQAENAECVAARLSLMSLAAQWRRLAAGRTGWAEDPAGPAAVGEPYAVFSPEAGADPDGWSAEQPGA